MAEEDKVETPVVQEVEEVVTDLPGAVKGVLKRALVVDGVIRGLHEVAKYIDAGKAQIVFLAESCNEATYKKLVQTGKNIPLIDVADNKQSLQVGLAAARAEASSPMEASPGRRVRVRLGRLRGPGPFAVKGHLFIRTDALRCTYCGMVRQTAQLSGVGACRFDQDHYRMGQRIWVARVMGHALCLTQGLRADKTECVLCGGSWGPHIWPKRRCGA